MLLLGEGSEATEPYNKYDKIRPHSIRSLQFDQKVRPLSFRPEKFDLFTATRIKHASNMSPFPLVPRDPLWPLIIPSYYAYTGYAPHIIRNVSANYFSLRRFGIFFAGTSAAMFLPKRPESFESRQARYGNRQGVGTKRGAELTSRFPLFDRKPSAQRKRTFEI